MPISTQSSCDSKIINECNKILYTSLAESDPEIHALIELEKKRQFQGLELIASENFTSVAVMEANGSILTNKYSEGLPGARYYGGNQFIDQIETICQQRALQAFSLSPNSWGVNVQPYSGSTANFAALTALLRPHDRIMGLDLPSGGHLTHGYQTAKKKISSSSIYFESLPYRVNAQNGLIDYDALEASASAYYPKLIICGASAYPRDWDYARLRRIADGVGALLLADIAHISGLVATGEAANPFDYCDIVTTTTHKTLRGPRAGLIFYRKLDEKVENEKTQSIRGSRQNGGINLEEAINFAVFPSTQGGPHNNTIAAIAVALKQACDPSFKAYIKQVRSNCVALSRSLQSHGYKMCTDGTDNHLLLWDLRPLGLTGSKFERVCEWVHLTVNKNSIAGDKSAISPGGVRLGTAALTSRGLDQKDFEQVAAFLKEAADLSLLIQGKSESKLLKDFVKVAENDAEIVGLIKNLGDQVVSFASRFPLPGQTPNLK